MRDYPVPAREELHKLWERFDYNGNGLLSLAEIDKLVREEYPQYDDKQALLRAYKFADQDGSGFITKNEFATLVRSLAYFKALAEEFREVDASGDRRIDFDEFLAGAPRMGLNLGEAEARAIFDKMDTDHGGLVLFGGVLCVHGPVESGAPGSGRTKERRGGAAARIIIR